MFSLADVPSDSKRRRSSRAGHFRRLQAVEVIGGALGMGGSGEDGPLVVLEHLEPRGDIGGMVFTHFEGDAEVGA